MPRSKEQYEEMRNATREKIHSTAMQLFVHQGFGSTNVQDIADTAGISIGLLYRHYKTKDQLFNELVSYAVEGLKRNITFFESDQSPKELMAQFVDEVYIDMINGEELAHLLILINQSLLAGAATASKHYEEILQVNARLLDSTAQLIRKGQQLGEFYSGDAQEMTALFYASIQGLAQMKVLLKSNFTMPSPSILTAFLLKERK
ncbi:MULTISPECIES: TetR/AcrR family transcriptional regulator [unclassified Paenibacillus]|uniref:TetR/AcrR family transcriptional regulator n=1 Tax=unclassified Paenibacillus TaxID=185978 RepID=UPI002780A1EB|nr:MULTISPECIES: TetR/AcrR family transcriptional regulator [unclassified Paenibacillus]MDQ0902028.1 AcrR family transcriptional regulator [Paenibacillus sp. V4I7]MDQ0919476.1 AcrR family transcriptional regulator [Paenibacillus sp. V4I5]